MGQVVSSSASRAAFLSTGFISLVPNVIFVLLPNDANPNALWLSLGQALAAGGLLGDVFLHTLTHHGMEEETGYWILVGFGIFFTTDLVIRSLQEAWGSPPINHTVCTKNNGQYDAVTQPQQIKQSLVILNLVADSLHNFTDGLAIGASYASAVNTNTNGTVSSILQSHTRGGLATLSILFHEIPHELGDFCTLVRGGYTKRGAVLAQFGTSLAAFCGTAAALLVQETQSTNNDTLIWITAGGFLYLSCTTILPEVLAESSERENDNDKYRSLFRMAQLGAFVGGIYLMHLVAHMEEQQQQQGEDGHGSHHHHHHGHEARHHEL